MLEKIISIDKQLLIFLNSFGSSTFDGFWLFITKQANWTPFFLVILYLVYKKIGWRNILIAFLFIALLVTIGDQTCNLVKNATQRLRPCNDEEINSIIRVVKQSDTFSFFSGHATNSMASTVFVFSILRKQYKHSYLLFLFPLIFAYSRIYLGLHFPIDIITGYTFGGTLGFLFYKLYEQKVLK